ncbi:unnamed protein product [Acanthoscelides obtectus]|uniref:PDZ domain-containing protein n=1 Tax=Acanthoscelides obtectus TaxID=200917 RepID=A0A9P0P8Z4_ACAOB|nr:unnamed protein product [Acanthoscelides obtectus]CAK1646952.1 Rho GTPase-activating protein 21-A [Acanthoscelides obtectus]
MPNPPGVVPLPRGSRGPRSLYLKRNGDSFGFTLRHFIVYPPDLIAEHYDGRHAAVGALLAPMDTIFVKQVRERSAAKRAGLQQGDRLVAVNGVPVKDKEYSQVVQLIQNSPEYLHLLFFAETAYNPVSNQQPDVPYDRQSAQQFLTHHLGRGGGAPGFQVDAISWRSLQQPYHGYPQEFPPLQRVAYDRGQRSADSLIYSEPKRHTRRENQHEIYAEIHPHEFVGRQKCRAAPQVPLYRKMGRRASEGSAHYDPPDASSLSTEEDYAMKTVYKGMQSADVPSGYPNTAGCRLSLDVGRRESTSSLSSSIADGSKDSLASYDSAATLTGHETDDSAIMTRFRKSVQQKEEFLRTPAVNTVEQALIRKEFYGRPKKLEKQMWPPTESPKASKPTHQNVLRVKGDIESERDMVGMGGGADYSMPQQKGVTSPRERGMKSDLDRVYEAATAPGGYDSLEPLNGSAVEEAYMDDQRQYHSLQVVHRRARDFESGRPPPPDDDPTAAARLTAAGSELARLGAKRLQPRVTERAMEYDARAATVSPPPQQQGETGAAVPAIRKQPQVYRDSRSLDGSGSNASSSSIPEDGEHSLPYASKRLSGNVTITSGSKYLHCPPPDANGEASPDSSKDNEVWKLRVRSSSAESWMPERNKTTDDILPAVSVTPPAPPPTSTAQQQQAPPQTVVARPTVLQLDEPPRRPVRGHFLRPPNMAALMADSDDERATRRESYLKATEGGRMHIDSDLSDGGDTSPHVLRSAHKRWRPPLFPGDIQQLRKLFEDAAASLGGSASSSSVSLDREKSTGSPVPLEKEKYNIIKEGVLNCKILEIDGKRATDRSWKQVHVVLKGPKLYMYKDKHHQVSTTFLL